ncbi:hypothetical protein EDD18DRAFT_1107743 [Armillaria luteobubalina]|uniref:Uncharacterized protein n=1 Tax=Armillaria luteobubalina TaxID=153913 RepID=A0AA39UR46_9AGAR|nr:hypothetical protein EDD18DRAFT_1107743 [Armillaria luteobubalina]
MTHFWNLEYVPTLQNDNEVGFSQLTGKCVMTNDDDHQKLVNGIRSLTIMVGIDDLKADGKVRLECVWYKSEMHQRHTCPFPDIIQGWHNPSRESMNKKSKDTSTENLMVATTEQDVDDEERADHTSDFTPRLKIQQCANRKDGSKSTGQLNIPSSDQGCRKQPKAMGGAPAGVQIWELVDECQYLYSLVQDTQSSKDTWVQMKCWMLFTLNKI